MGSDGLDTQRCNALDSQIRRQFGSTSLYAYLIIYEPMRDASGPCIREIVLCFTLEMK
jgi:hypothetical protein